METFYWRLKIILVITTINFNISFELINVFQIITYNIVLSITVAYQSKMPSNV